MTLISLAVTNRQGGGRVVLVTARDGVVPVPCCVRVCVCVCSCAHLSGHMDVLKDEARHWFFSVLIALLLVRDIFSDFITDFWKNKDEPVELPEEVAIVTGGARGIGVDVVKKLMRSGVCVVVGCRDLGAGSSLLKGVRDAGVLTGHLESYQLDLTSMNSVETFAESVLADYPDIHILVNNAGITTSNRKLTEDGVESTFSVNYLGHFYLTHLLLPRMAETARNASRNARIVNVTSCVHAYPLLGDLHVNDLSLRHNYQEYVAYGQSKTAQMLFTKTLNAKLQASHLPVQVHAVHPGVVFTYMMTQNIFHMVFPWVFPIVLRTSESASRSVFHACASPELESRGGTYIASCEVAEPGTVASSSSAQKQLWQASLDLLHLQDFGGLVK